MQNEIEAFAQIKEILRLIKKVEYGSVEIIIHDNQIVQIETREKIRFEKSKAILRNSKSPSSQLEAESSTPSQLTGTPER
jgi:hypothetical protein